MPARPFCLSKPTNSTDITTHPHSLCAQTSISSLGLRHSQSLQRGSSKYSDEHADIRRSYDMISRQIRCSAAVPIVPPRPKIKKIVRKQEPKKQTIFMQNFEEMSRILIPNRESQGSFPTRRKRTTKWTKFITKTCPNDHQASFSQQNNDQPRRQESDGYYARLKKRLKRQIQGLTAPVCDRLTEELQMKNDKENDVRAALRRKGQLKNSETWVRVTRTGMVVPVSEVERKARGTNLAMIENYKAKKDFNFRRCLAKNCSIILQQIARQETASEKSPDRERKQRDTQPSESILRNTHISRQREESLARQSADGAGVLRWKERCMQIEISCRKGLERNSTEAGLRVFSKYSKRVQLQLQADQIALTSILRCEPSQQMEEKSSSLQKTFLEF